jgi:hypothetical protein
MFKICLSDKSNTTSPRELHSVTHDFAGRVTAIGNLNIHYGGFVQRIQAVGDIEVYNIFGRILSIDGHPCTYRAWYSSCISAVGTMEIKRHKMGKVLAIGSMSLAYKGWFGNFISIGDVQIIYKGLGKMAEVITSGGDLTRQQKIALTVMLIEKYQSETAD